MKTTSYFGRDAAGDLWARVAVVRDDGSEDAERHVSVRVGDHGRDAEAAMRLALELFTMRMSSAVPMVSGGAC